MGRASPTGSAGCYCARICPPRRLDFLDGEFEPDEILRWLAEKLEPETGLNFAGGAADAFGSLEIFGFPSLDENERSLVDVTYERETENRSCTVKVSLAPGANNTDYLVQVRTELVRDVATDHLAPIDAATRMVTFQVPDPIDGALVRIWKRDATAALTLWHEQEDHFIRSIGMGMNIAGIRGRLDSDWLKELENSRQARSRVEAFRNISQVSTSSPMETSTRARWETAGRFFEKGWAGKHRLDFAEWLRDQLSRSGGDVILIDPYFDVSGLDLVVRASGAARQLVVLTCTQTTSLDDDGHDQNRADRLVSACEQLHAILRGVKLRLLDLRSRGGGRSQLFHDRYLLLYGAAGEVRQGFNLSTSLQSATRTSPLLVTPIPSDVIDAVSDYVTTLRDPSETNAIEILYPPSAKPSGLGPTPYRARAALGFVKDEEIVAYAVGEIGEVSRRVSDELRQMLG